MDTSLPADHDALSSAFDPEAPPAPKPIEHNVPAEQPQETAPDDTAVAHQQFAMELARVRQEAATAEKDDARKVFKDLASLADAAGPVAQQQLHELEAKTWHRLKDASAHARAVKHWLESCGPTHVDACRVRALAALQGNAERVAQVRKHDQCVTQAEANPSPKPPCLGSAIAFYEREGDALMAQRALWARAQSDAHALTAQSFSQVERACTQPRCVEQRRRILRQGSSWCLHNNEAKQGALMALNEAGLASEELPPDQRTYARTSAEERACAALDAQEGAGSCRRLEKETLGRYLFRDYSREQLRGEGLPPDRVKVVNEEFNVLIQECLNEQAGRMEPPSAERYVVRWVVTNAGRVDQVHMDKKNVDDGPLAQCLRQQFAAWRYPRYKGELQGVEQTFIVSAREKRYFPRAAR